MAEPIDDYFTATISAMNASQRQLGDDEPVREGSSLTARVCLALFDVALGSRHLDLAARYLRSQGKGYYTIGSSGHEGNGAVAAALRPTDPALLHYRSGAFFLARAALVEGRESLRDVLLGLVAATDEPISGGRHKVFGRRDLHIIPQTSTIASHLPRAVGVAFSIARAKKLGVACAWPEDAITVCSFGDASVNHSTAVGAINTALHASYQGVPMPLLFVCEDNGIGISVPTPRGWIERTYGSRDGLAYFAADGSDLAATFDAAVAAADWVRTRRRPAFLHLRTVRLMGHAGSDYEPAYRRPEEIAAEYDRDPVLCTAKLLIDKGVLTPADVLDRYEAKRADVIELAEEVSELAQLDSAHAVMEPLRTARDDAQAAVPASLAASVQSGEPGTPMTLAAAINRALHDILDRYPEAMIFGEDVARKGGVYGVTRGLLSATQFGAGVRHAARRAVDPRPGARRGGVGTAADPRNPVPRLLSQRRGPDSRRGRDTAVLLQPPVPQSDGGPGSRLRIPEGVRRTLPQRQLHRRDARHPRCGDRITRRGPTTPPRCCTPVRPPRGRRARYACSSSPSRSITPEICTTTTTAAGWRRIRSPAWRSAGHEPTATAPI